MEGEGPGERARDQEQKGGGEGGGAGALSGLRKAAGGQEICLMSGRSEMEGIRERQGGGGDERLRAECL